jgi:restriction endonuclease S subunit
MLHLKDIATIRSGVLFREKIQTISQGGVRVVQISDITPEARLSIDSLSRIELPEIKASQFLQPGDCLFISRGPRKQTVAITAPLEKTIATSQFFVLHPDPARMRPDFLAWYLNQRPAQRYIESESRGSKVSLLNLEALKMLPVEVPPLETQHRILRIFQLSLREKELLEAIQFRRRALIERELMQLAQGHAQSDAASIPPALA